jgi:ADP-ribose pyrophosphatase YjhB (NUDIX family)
MNQADSMRWARQLQAIGQTGLHFAENPYDRERYRQIGAIAAEIVASQSNLTKDQVLQLSAAEFGYATPKVDVRGVVFRDGDILLVREIADDGRWTVPGGWADVNESPAEAVVREVREESGFETRAVRLLAAYDRERQGHPPPLPYHIYKLFFLCEIVGGSPRPNREVSDIQFFAPVRLPELSRSRVTETQIQRFIELRQNPEQAADFD